MHSDQMRKKDGISEPMIQALYYDFVANYMSRPGCTVHVMCSVIVAILHVYLAQVHDCMQKFICRLRGHAFS